MSSSESDSDDLFYYSGRKEIQKQFEKRLSESNDQSHIEIKTIFHSDEEEQIEVEKPKTSRTSKKRSCPKEEVTETRINASMLLAQFDQNIDKELKRQSSKRRTTDVLNSTIESIQRDLARREKQYKENSQLQDFEEEEEEVEKEVIQPEQKPISSLIEILTDEERQSVLDDEYTGKEGTIALKLRSTSDETNVVIIRMPTSCTFNVLIESLPVCGFPGGRIQFDCEDLNPKKTPTDMDMEDGDILDVEV